MQHGVQQQEAIARINAWRKSVEPLFILNGYAGTGKTTVARVFEDENTIFLAYTGKAVNVLKNKGVKKAQTVHSFLYACKGGKEDGREKELAAIREEMKTCKDDARRWTLKRRYDEITQPSFGSNDAQEKRDHLTLVVDEWSMLTQRMLDDLLRTGAKVLLLGDPGQLPPVKGDSIDMSADFVLTDVHRQAAENAVLRAATMVRQSGRMPSTGGEFKLITPAQSTAQDYLDVEQVICGRNKTRLYINKRYRVNKYGTTELELLMPQEKLIVLRNFPWLDLYNGTQCWVNHQESELLDVRTDGNKEVTFTADLFTLNGGIENDRDNVPIEYGYGITCHKAQGSEWGSILVKHEVLGRDPEMNKRWLYTALTRARNTAVVVSDAN